MSPCGLYCPISRIDLIPRYRTRGQKWSRRGGNSNAPLNDIRLAFKREPRRAKQQMCDCANLDLLLARLDSDAHGHGAREGMRNNFCRVCEAIVNEQLAPS